jgi:recombination protein RecT
MSTNTNGQANGQMTKIDSLKSMLNAPSVQEQFKNALADNSGPFVASLIDLYSGDNYLQNCEPKAVIMECLKAAVLKLPINKSLGFAYIVPYKSNNVLVPQFQIGYKGLIQLAMRTGQYRIINADMVYEGEFRTRNKLTGEFDLSGTKTSDVIVGYFAYIELLNGFSKTLYMTKEKVTAHAKKYSKSYAQPSGPWTKEFDAMAIKTVLRNLLSHYGFLSVDMVSAFDNDADQDVADRVQGEIRSNANVKDAGFSEAEVVNDIPEVNNSNGPGF